MSRRYPVFRWPGTMKPVSIANRIANNMIGLKTAAMFHRKETFLLIVIFLIHVGGLSHRKFVEGQKGIFRKPDSLVPNIKDIKGFFAYTTCLIGVLKETQKYGRWIDSEKFDCFFALFPGMMIIGGASGLTLWFTEIFTRWRPGWLINATHIIPSGEGLLVTAFLFTINFFNIHLRSGAFPGDEIIFTGGVTKK